MNGNDGTKRIPQTITEPPTCFTAGIMESELYASSAVPEKYILPEVGNSVKENSTDHITQAFPVV
jgi:hypothetical protein